MTDSILTSYYSASEGPLTGQSPSLAQSARAGESFQSIYSGLLDPKAVAMRSITTPDPGLSMATYAAILDVNRKLTR